MMLILLIQHSYEYRRNSVGMLYVFLFTFLFSYDTPEELSRSVLYVCVWVFIFMMAYDDYPPNSRLRFLLFLFMKGGVFYLVCVFFCDSFFPIPGDCLKNEGMGGRYMNLQER